ncbi:5-hydroxytryptamine receptor 3C-like [Corythoichthys intestinalis]|uniref:5-hydroxytryptamine receptor 3C-like n=1 Tax=Corythoichthys intestinalis TaxID=161448 RepID=UPI0025A6050F|nr:5-hydroxytryptamine receptor 3C-like [Corythoichthys intestinalis]
MAAFKEINKLTTDQTVRFKALEDRVEARTENWLRGHTVRSEDGWRKVDTILRQVTELSGQRTELSRQTATLAGRRALRILFCLQTRFVAALKCTSKNPESIYAALETDLFPKKIVPPVQSFLDPINITITVNVLEIFGVDEKAQTMTLVISQYLTWRIEGLHWNERECGTNRVSVPRENLWIPDIHISEFLGEDNSPKSTHVFLHNTGDVLESKTIRVVSSCPLVIYAFPFDVQNCSLTFKSYLHQDSDIRMIQGATTEETLQASKKLITSNGEWELVDIKIAPSVLTLSKGNYSEMKYHIVLKRQPMLYVVNLLLPSCFLITVDLFSFLLPPQSVDRSSFKMTLILGYTVFLLIMNDLLPVTGQTTPLMNVFFSISLALMVASLLETIFITNIQFASSQYSTAPRWITILVLRYLALVVYLPPQKKSSRVTVSLQHPNELHISKNPENSNDSITDSTIGEEPQKTIDPQQNLLDELRKLSKDLIAIRLHVDNHFKSTNTSQEWYMIGIVVDRLLFAKYVIFILTSFLTITFIWIWSDSF